MSLGYAIFATESLNSEKTINLSAIMYLLKKIFKFLKLINFSWIRYLSDRIFKFFTNNKCERDKVSVQENLQIPGK